MDRKNITTVIFIKEMKLIINLKAPRKFISIC